MYFQRNIKACSLKPEILKRVSKVIVLRVLTQLQFKFSLVGVITVRLFVYYGCGSPPLFSIG